MERERVRSTFSEGRERYEGLTTSDPWLTSHFDFMRHFMRDMGRPFEGWGYPRTLGQTSSHWPLIEMFERGGQVTVRAELPGVAKDDVQVRIVGDSLVIEGEWSYGYFARRIPLPANVDPDQFSAKFENGVLDVKLDVTSPSAR